MYPLVDFDLLFSIATASWHQRLQVLLHPELMQGVLYTICGVQCCALQHKEVLGPTADKLTSHSGENQLKFTRSGLHAAG